MRDSLSDSGVLKLAVRTAVSAQAYLERISPRYNHGRGLFWLRFSCDKNEAGWMQDKLIDRRVPWLFFMSYPSPLGPIFESWLGPTASAGLSLPVQSVGSHKAQNTAHSNAVQPQTGWFLGKQAPTPETVLTDIPGVCLQSAFVHTHETLFPRASLVLEDNRTVRTHTKTCN